MLELVVPKPKGTKRESCPVCGRHFKGSLKDHLERWVPGSTALGQGVTRCEWNLTEHRLARAVEHMKRTGWCLAGSTAARVLSALKDSHPHLVRMAPSGAYHTKVGIDALDPSKDLKCWWTRPWCRTLAEVSPWPTMIRIRMVIELEGKQDLQDIVESAWRVGGAHAVASLLGTALPARCACTYNWQPPMPDRMGQRFRTENCRYADGHEGPHLSIRGDKSWDDTVIGPDVPSTKSSPSK